MQGGTRSPSVVGSDFGSWLVAREPALHRTATLLTGDEITGRNLALPALARLRLAWRGLDPLDADDRARALLVDEYRRTWGRAAGPAPRVPAGEYGDAEAATWALVRSLPPRSRAVVVLRFHQHLTERETAELVRLTPLAVRSEETAVLAALREHLDEERERHPGRSLPPDPAALLTGTLHARGEDASYLGCDPAEVDATARVLRGRRRRRTTVGLVAALAVVVGVAVAVSDPAPPVPVRPALRDAPVASVGPLGSFVEDAPPALPYLVRNLFLAPGEQRELPVAHPRSATPYRGDLWVTELYFDVFDTLRRIDADGRQTGKWATSGDPVVSNDGHTFAWIEVLGTRSVIHRGADRQRVGEPIWLVGLLGDRVVYNGTRAGGAWITDLVSPPRPIPGLALGRGVDPATGGVSGTATNGDGVVVDALTGVARWRSSRWRPGAISPDGKHVLAFSTAREDVVGHAILDAERGRPVTLIPSPFAGILDLRWEDAAHVLLVATDQGQSSMLRVDLDGRLTEARPPLPPDVVGGPAYQFAVR